MIPRDQSTECINDIIVKNGQEIAPYEKIIQSQGIWRCDIDWEKHCHVIGGVQFDYYINLIRKKIKKIKKKILFHKISLFLLLGRLLMIMKLLKHILNIKMMEQRLIFV